MRSHSNLIRIRKLKLQLLLNKINLERSIDEFYKVSSNFAIHGCRSEIDQNSSVHKYEELSEEGKLLFQESKRIDKHLERVLQAVTLSQIGVKFTTDEIHKIIDR